MREIKFRAWDKEKKRMYFGDLRTFNSIAPFCNAPKKFHIMQFTGLTDKTGKEIYEGDVVNMKVLIDYNVNIEIDRTYTGVVAVIPSKGACMKRPKFIDRCEDDRTVWCDYNKPIAAYRSEVIGNVYENPELIAEGQS
jgi:uncharacterized phage protein (TIGR01671 family)